MDYRAGNRNHTLKKIAKRGGILKEAAKRERVMWSHLKLMSWNPFSVVNRKVWTHNPKVRWNWAVLPNIAIFPEQEISGNIMEERVLAAIGTGIVGECIHKHLLSKHLIKKYTHGISTWCCSLFWLDISRSSYVIWRSKLLAPEPSIKRGPQSQRVQRHPPAPHHHYTQIQMNTYKLCLCPQSLGNKMLIYGVCGTLNGTRRSDRVKKGMTFRV